jgi:class 3 adenylate cyclase
VLIDLLAPSIAGDAEIRRTYARYERLSASPGAAAAIISMLHASDVRHVLPAIQVPALVIHRAGPEWIPPEHGRYMAKHIPGARYVELPGTDKLLWSEDVTAILGEVEEFITGARHAPEVGRVLTTVLFTDIVGSTERAAEIGDRRWRELLAEHDRLVRRELDRYRGREVKTTGDGFLATFDGPARAIRAAQAISAAVGAVGIEVRAGLHAGEIEVLDRDVGGIAVHTAARVGAMAAPREVLVSSTVKDLVAGSGIEFSDRGVHTLKGVPGDWRVFSVTGS